METWEPHAVALEEGQRWSEREVRTQCETLPTAWQGTPVLLNQ